MKGPNARKKHGLFKELKAYCDWIIMLRDWDRGCGRVVATEGF